MSNNKQSSVEFLISQLKKSKDWHRVLNEVSQMSSAKIDILEQAKDMFYDQIYQAFEQGRISGYDEAVAELVKGETFFGLKDGEDYIKENYG